MDGRGGPVELNVICEVLPPVIAGLVRALPAEALACLEEVRVRAERPLAINASGRERFVTEQASLTDDPGEGRTVTRQECQEVLARLTRSSLYAFEDEVRNGFVTLRGGHRCGLVGKAVLENGMVRTMRSFAGFNLRLAREVRGAADRVLPGLIDRHTRHILSTLVISPPQAGKTTLLRDIARQASLGVPELRIPGRKVGIVDERSELAGCLDGVPQRDLGPRTDVVDGCPKAEGTFILLRAMSSEIIVMDELGRERDVEAVAEATNAGVTVIASAHARNLEEVLRRPSLAALVDGRFFARLVVLSARRGPGTVEEILPLESPGSPGITSLTGP